MNAPEIENVLGMTAGTIGKDLLFALVQEVKLLPDVWPKLSEAKQNDIIDRLRNRVETNVKMAVHLIASEGRTVVCGDLDQITIKGGVKAVVKFGASAPNLHELYESSGKAVLVVVAEASAHMGGMDGVTGEADQRAMDLGHEYHDNDGGGMGDGQTIEGEVVALPAPIPEHDGEAADDPIYADAARAVVTEQRPSVSFLQRRFRIGYNRAARLLERMEKEGVVSTPDANGARVVFKTLDDLGGEGAE